MLSSSHSTGRLPLQAWQSLTSGVDVDRALRPKGDETAKFVGAHRPQAVRGDAKIGPGQAGDGSAARLDHLLEASKIGDEALLAVRGRRAAKAAVGVEDRQQGEADAGLGGGGGDAYRHLTRVGIGAPVDIVVQIVEFADAGEAGLQHLGEGLGGDRLDVLGGEAGEEPVHPVSPGPEVVGVGSSIFGEPGHGALKGVAVDIAEAGNTDAVGLILGRGRDGLVDGADRAVLDRNAHPLGPAVGEQGGLEPQGEQFRRLRYLPAPL